ncbi:MAG: MarR family winged helix-turn-helix transcriptional regulator [Methylohalobius sp.]|nr:MarR family winged helix-turn-helix transcriptional regulator [Methylohalobius sp.]
MSAYPIYEYLERIANLLRAQVRSTQGLRLQPVQLEILHYLSICNRHSNTAAAVTEYLGLTKGTVSQTLSVLESKGYLHRVQDAKDKRVTRLYLTPKAKALLAEAWPPPLLQLALDRIPFEQQQQLIQGLNSLLQGLQSAHRLKAFGVCRTCRYLKQTGENRSCGLTGLPLAEAELNLICREHLPSSPNEEIV